MAEDNSWVFDSLVCFLHGPVWNAPLQTFIEDKSLIFDPNVTPDEDNPEFRKVHDEYKNLVDYMLGSFMEEMHITPEQFEFACLEGRNTAAVGAEKCPPTRAGETEGDKTFSFHQGLFQQIWAANDIRIFIRMMTQRNVEIQLQALDLIERRQALSQEAPVDADDDDDDAVGQQLVEREVAVESGRDEVAEKNTHGAGIEQDIVGSVDDDVKVKSLPESADSGPTGDEAANVNDKFQRLNLFFEQDTVNSDDMQNRQQYLRAQRDKILQIKKQARARQLNESIKRNERPASAQVAQRILEGDVLLGGFGSAQTDSAPESSLQLRKMLAERLRNEIVERK
ncbi:cilia- and flagella-associated protein 36 [Wyeomyia smithii]|uniref:cilia- and flagella-associated protein 36 n=1 Tax=Wyeomyia smithii TaxID=174621 RepID=UPI002467B9A5|nr:cilia- and flagella-associated protein 36 [Wyeomyia smithii]